MNKLKFHLCGIIPVPIMLVLPNLGTKVAKCDESKNEKDSQ